MTGGPDPGAATPPPLLARIAARIAARIEPLDDAREALAAFAPALLGTLVLAGGLVLLFAGSFPPTNETREALRSILPLPFVEASHLSASLAGLALVLLSRGLYRRIARANRVAVIFLAAGAVFAVLRGLEWTEALPLGLIALLLHATRGEFFRQGGWPALRPPPGWIALLAVAVAASTLVGLIGYRNEAYRNDLWWSFAWQDDAPRFLRATLATSVLVAALALDRLLIRPAAMAHTPSAIPPAVRRLVAESPSAARNLALLGDKSFVLSPDERAFLMYGTSGRSWICLAGPVGAPDAFRDLVWDFTERADRAGCRAVFCAVPGETIHPFLDLGHAIIKMGEMARVDLAGFSLDGPARKDLRYARSRALRDGLAFSLLPRAEVPAHLDELRAVSDAWLATKKGREKGFALGYFDADYLRLFDMAVMRREGRIVAFANIWRSGGKIELAVDLMRHLPGQSGVLMEAFFTELILLAKAEGYGHFLLGGAPMSGMPEHRLAPVWARIGTLIYRHGDELYSFEGLRAFKEKFAPVWTPIYLTCPTSLSFPRVLLDLALLVNRAPATEDEGD
ncbi:MAG: bifunctional lysylphosphatidylglycerol flippase/synthetase MprF [Proteobacteria bacterium]|nr:bifunctional lysylphosphatidylglycerol flippase/synthetase MprF [Pseudomonadota bacterium]MBS0572387.1 bifunctional lysylphosphatidylglycerol flippase/synthetase MprF [Pseudomonadota bacterium]